MRGYLRTYSNPNFSGLARITIQPEDAPHTRVTAWIGSGYDTRILLDCLQTRDFTPESGKVLLEWGISGDSFPQVIDVERAE